MAEFDRIAISSREDWLRIRRGFQSASESAAIMGLSRFMSQTELFDIKTGRKEPKDLSAMPQIRYGVAMEPLVRDMAMIELPYFRLEYRPYDLLISKSHPYMSCTLDGELYVTDEGNPWGLRAGDMVVYEGKTGSFRNRKDLDKWIGDGNEKLVPIEYWIQVLHQLFITRAKGALMGVRLRRDPYRVDDEGLPEVLSFYRWIDASSEEVKKDMDMVVIANEDWHIRLQKDERPAMVLSL